MAEADEHLLQPKPLALAAKPCGGEIHEARIAAIRLSCGVTELRSADREFPRLPALAPRNPLIG